MTTLYRLLPLTNDYHLRTGTVSPLLVAVDVAVYAVVMGVILSTLLFI